MNENVKNQQETSINTPEDFLAAGYRESKLSEYQMKKADRFFQKRIKDSVGIRYHINVYYYDFSMYPVSPKIGYSSDVQFQDPDDLPTLDISISSNNIEEIEQTFDNLWNKIGRPYYEEY